MKQCIKTLLGSLFCLSSYPLQPFEQKVIQANGLEFWTETFGNPKNPTLLLVHGSGAQGLLWHQKFCEQLADKGFFVIRYDHRDVGLSSTVDYAKSPYTVLDMAKDAIIILDEYDIKKAHVVGASLGGEIAMLMAAHFPDRVSHLTLLMTSTDFAPLFNALNGNPSTSLLSSPKPAYLTWAKSYITDMPKTLNEKVERYLEGGRILTGLNIPFEEQLQRQLALQMFVRTRDPLSFLNHLKAIEASYDLHKQAPSKVKAPTLILHGDQDPMLPPDHGEALKKAIPHAELITVAGLGHALNSHFYNLIIDKIAGLSKNN